MNILTLPKTSTWNVHRQKNVGNVLEVFQDFNSLVNRLNLNFSKNITQRNRYSIKHLIINRTFKTQQTSVWASLWMRI